MSEPPGIADRGPHLVLYDGECGLCHGLVQFVLPRDPRGVFHFAPLQGRAAKVHLAPFGGVPARLSTVYVVSDYRTDRARCWVKGRAVMFILRRLRWPWPAFVCLGFLPTLWMDAVYDAVARHRHRVLGRPAACLMPLAEYRDRFPDLGDEGLPGGNRAG